MKLRDLKFFVDQPCNSVDTLLLLEREFLFDGLHANLGVGTVSLLSSSLLATNLTMLSRTGTPNVAL